MFKCHYVSFNSTVVFYASFERGLLLVRGKKLIPKESMSLTQLLDNACLFSKDVSYSLAKKAQLIWIRLCEEITSEF